MEKQPRNKKITIALCKAFDSDRAFDAELCTCSAECDDFDCAHMGCSIRTIDGEIYPCYYPKTNEETDLGLK